VYDSRSEAREFLGDDVAEATAKACSYFGVAESALTVRPVSDVSGLGGRVIVVAQPTEARGRSRGSEVRGRDEGRGERGGRDEGRGGRERGGRDRERGGRGGRDRERGRGGRGGRDRGDRDREFGGRDREREREFGGRDRERERDEAPEEEAAPVGPSVGTARGELGEVGDYVKGLIERMELGPFEIERIEQDGVEVFRIEGAAAQGLTRGDGRTPDAIQLLANQVASRSNEDAPRIVVDVEGNHERREAFLTRVAERAAQRARETGRTVALDPMGPRDRRSIHVALRDAEDVATMSVGEGRYRQVMVVPEGAPEYEEARAAATEPSA
jgi:predicted RNA-binding protein Jag